MKKTPRDTHERLRESKPKDRRAKTECQSREEWGHYVPNTLTGTSTEDRARTSHPAVRCRVEEKALVEQEAEVGG